MIVRTFLGCLSLVFLPLLAGCQATHTLEEADLDYSQGLLSEVYVTVKGDYGEHEIRNLVRARGLFSQVRAGQAPEEGYTLRITAEKSSNDMDNYPWMLLGALTAFICPVPQEDESHIDAQLFKGANLLKTYRYSNRSNYYVSLFHLESAEVDRRANLGRMISHLIFDMQKDELLR